MSYKTIHTLIQKVADIELSYANANNEQVFNSDHEGYAVILEEMEEAGCDYHKLRNIHAEIWSCVMNDKDIGMLAEDMRSCALRLACEAVQVAAMAKKFALSNEIRRTNELKKRADFMKEWQEKNNSKEVKK